MGCFVIGLTGQTGAGKSTVSRVLADCGIPVVDCDRLAREAVKPGSECLLQLVRAFGRKILRPDGSLDRAGMAAMAFPDPEKLAVLNRITHKAILQLLTNRLKELEAAGQSLVVVDAPTLFESGADRLCGAVVSVTAPEAFRLERILALGPFGTGGGEKADGCAERGSLLYRTLRLYIGKRWLGKGSGRKSPAVSPAFTRESRWMMVIRKGGALLLAAILLISGIFGLTKSDAVFLSESVSAGV